jgi:hypothetical protein
MLKSKSTSETLKFRSGNSLKINANTESGNFVHFRSDSLIVREKVRIKSPTEESNLNKINQRLRGDFVPLKGGQTTVNSDVGSSRKFK